MRDHASKSRNQRQHTFMSEAIVIGGKICSQLRSAERISDGTFSH